MAGDHDLASGSHAAAAAPGDDALSDVLEVVRLTGALFFVVDAAAPWAAAAPESAALSPAILPRAQHVISYHVIVRGTCWCRMPGAGDVRLDAGDVIVIPHGDSYTLSSEAGLASGVTDRESLEWFRAMASGHLPLLVREGGDGPTTVQVVCGFLGCDALPFNPVLAALPRLVQIKPPGGQGRDRLSALVDYAMAETLSHGAGSRSVLVRVGELLFVEVVRRHLEKLGADQGGWLAGLRDPVVGRALDQLHRAPARAWTLEALARAAGASRSVLVERFTMLVGEPPMHYLSRWRIQRAAALLTRPGSKVTAVAREVGFESEAAFSRAFKKQTGTPPATWRRGFQDFRIPGVQD